MRSSLASALLLGVCAVLSCKSRTTPLSEADRAAIADTLEQLTQSIAESANALDPDRALSVFSSDPAMTWANDGQVLALSRDSLMTLYRSIYGSWRSMHFVWDSLRIAVLASDAGVVTATGHFTVTDSGGQVARRRVAATYVFVRRGGGWELLHGHASHVSE